ncbi:MAG: sugar transferase [Candidatus Omnitrophica bacterium]|nr:sugar transferase [Candidatus Omnitrophota bacterium]
MNYFVIKRFFDYALALLGFFIFLPFMAIVIFLIFIDDGLPIFYVKRTAGIYGKVFNILKFRSMEKNSLCITRIGKFLRKTAMDELPQLAAIVKGEMSFVGPRPYSIDKYGISKDVNIDKIPLDMLNSDKMVFAQRLNTIPGLTGLAQLYAPKHASDNEVLQFDLKYINMRNFWFDLYLILLSVWVTVQKKWERKDKKL